MYRLFPLWGRGDGTVTAPVLTVSQDNVLEEIVLHNYSGYWREIEVVKNPNIDGSGGVVMKRLSRGNMYRIGDRKHFRGYDYTIEVNESLVAGDKFTVRFRGVYYNYYYWWYPILEKAEDWWNMIDISGLTWTVNAGTLTEPADDGVMGDDLIEIKNDTGSDGWNVYAYAELPTALPIDKGLLVEVVFRTSDNGIHGVIGFGDGSKWIGIRKDSGILCYSNWENGYASARNYNGWGYDTTYVVRAYIFIRQGMICDIVPRKYASVSALSHIYISMYNNGHSLYLRPEIRYIEW